MTLCSVCFLDLGSIDGVYWGLSSQKRIMPYDLALVRDLHEGELEHDNYCTACQCRSCYMNAVLALRDFYSPT